jgi:hypothetical protein
MAGLVATTTRIGVTPWQLAKALCGLQQIRRQCIKRSCWNSIHTKNELVDQHVNNSLRIAGEGII